MHRPMSRIATLLFLVPALAFGGVVETTTGRTEGKTLIQPDGVTIDGKQLPWTDVLLVLTEPAVSTLPRPHLARLKNGEAWAGQFLTASSKQLQMRCDWFKQKPVDLSSLAVLDFVPQPPPSAGMKRQTLYRERGEPVPGALLWMEKDSLGLDSPLGFTTIKREGLVRYVFDAPKAAALEGQADEVQADEVGLIDGSIFRGRLEPGKEVLCLEQAVLGRLEFPTRAVRFVVRHNAVMLDLALASPAVLEAGEGGLAKGNLSVLAPSPLATEPSRGFVRAVRIEPKLKIRYPLPKRTGGKLFCRATLAPVQAAQGDTRIKITVGPKTVLEKELSAAARPEPFDLDLPEGDDLVVDVDFGALLRFPCGVLLEDLHLVLVK